MIVARYGAGSEFGGVYAEVGYGDGDDEPVVVNVSWFWWDDEWVDPPEGSVFDDWWAWHWAPGWGPCQRAAWLPR